MKKTSKLVSALAGVTAIAALAVGSAQADQPFELVIKAGPGSGVSQLAHKAAELLPKYLDSDVGVLYKKGGSGAVAQAYIQNRDANGYHPFVDTTTTAIVLAGGKTPFTEEDWVGVIRMQVDPQGIAVRSDSPWQNFGDLVEHIRKNPGTIRWTGAHSVGMDPFTVSKLLESADLSQEDIKYVPSRKATEMKTNLLGGHVDVATLNPGEARDQVEAGKFRMLGIAHTERIATFPDWQTFKEQGFDVEAAIWRGVLVKKGTPQEMIDKLHEAFLKLRADPEFAEFMKQQLALDGYLGGPEKFDAYFKDQVKTLRVHFAPKPGQG